MSSDISNLSHGMDQLRDEIERLQGELEETSRQKIQAAEYGLAVLEEKQQLQQQCEELESLYETTKHDLDCAKEALAQTQQIHKRVSAIGVSQEESLLQESASREAELLRNISDLEYELRTTRHNLEQFRADTERANTLASDLSHQVEQLEGQNRQIRKDLKEMKFRESRTMTDYSELEEENVALQKQLLTLKQAQVDFEAMKYENRRLKEDLEELSVELEEVAKLKKIVEKNLEEALANLAQEREQKHSLKKELDKRITSESLFNLQTLAHLRLNEASHGTQATDSQEGPALKRIEEDFTSNTDSSAKDVSPTSSIPASQGIVGDLFSEIHLTEIRKLEKLLEDVEIQKAALEGELTELRQHLSVAEQELAARDSTIEKLKGQMTVEQVLPTVEEEAGNETVEELESQLSSLRKQGAAGEEGQDVNEELTRLQSRTAEQEELIKRLETDLAVMSQLAGESQDSLNSTQDDLVQVTEDIAQLYHLVCEVNGETPNRLMLEHARGKRRVSSAKQRTNIENTASVTTKNGSTQIVQEPAIVESKDEEKAAEKGTAEESVPSKKKKVPTATLR